MLSVSKLEIAATSWRKIMITVRIPATSANLGPGFDCLGLALNLYNYIHVEKSDTFQIHLKGSYTENLPTDQRNLVWRSMCELWKTIDFPIPIVSLTLETYIPPARGLGSSSAAIIGGLVAANAYAGSVLSKRDILQLANRLEGHPDNVTPALYGGITLAVETAENILARTLLSQPNFNVLAIVPDFLLETDKSREVLPTMVSRRDTVYNISHAALLVEALIHEEYEFLQEGMLDRIHQNQRASLVPGLPETLEAALQAGAYGAALSGSGPTVLAIVRPDKISIVSEKMLASFSAHGLNAKCYELSVDSVGATLISFTAKDESSEAS
jgi:homoserine kinase